MSRTYDTNRINPTQDRGKEKVRLILSAASKLFNQKGVAEVTTNEIAEAAGIPVGSIYRYFKDKDALVHALINVYVQDTAEIFEHITLDPMLPLMSWEELIRTVLNYWSEYNIANRPNVYLNFKKSIPAYDDTGDKLRNQNAEAFCHMLNARWQVSNSKPLIPATPIAALSLMTCSLVAEHTTKVGHQEAGEYIDQASSMLGAYLQSKYPI